MPHSRRGLRCFARQVRLADDLLPAPRVARHLTVHVPSPVEPIKGGFTERPGLWDFRNDKSKPVANFAKRSWCSEIEAMCLDQSLPHLVVAYVTRYREEQDRWLAGELVKRRHCRDINVPAERATQRDDRGV